MKIIYSSIKVEDVPFGKFTVTVDVEEEEDIGFCFKKIVKKTYKRPLNEWGKLASPWWECKIFDTKGEAELFIKWYLKRSIEKK